MEALHSQGMALLQALEAGARAGRMMPMWSEDSVDTLIKEISRNDAIGYIYLIGSDGKVSHHGGAIQLSDPIFPSLLPDDDSPIREEVRSPAARRFTSCKASTYPISFESGHHQQ
jgi:hypothetical protein